jgi:Spy/CpxP family protein refolding chaperone
MKGKWIKTVLLTIVFFMSAASVWTQDNPMPNRERVRENIITLRLLRLTQALDITEEQAAKIFPMANKIEREKLGLQKQMSAAIKDLRKMLKDPSIKDADIETKLAALKDARQQIKEKDEELEKYLESHLTTVQKAKYILFNIEFMMGLRDTLNRARMMRNNHPPIKN